MLEQAADEQDFEIALLTSLWPFRAQDANEKWCWKLYAHVRCSTLYRTWKLSFSPQLTIVTKPAAVIMFLCNSTACNVTLMCVMAGSFPFVQDSTAHLCGVSGSRVSFFSCEATELFSSTGAHHLSLWHGWFVSSKWTSVLTRPPCHVWWRPEFPPTVSETMFCFVSPSRLR